MTPEKKHKPRGGKKEGAGRHLKYGVKTQTTSFRVPTNAVDDIRAVVKKRLEEIAEEWKLKLINNQTPPPSTETQQ